MKRDGFCNSKDLIPASLEGHDIRLEQIQHRPAIEPVRADALASFISMRKSLPSRSRGTAIHTLSSFS